MRAVTDCVEIDAPPDRVWSWLAGLSERYTGWHPAHVSAEWERGQPDQVGSIMRAVEDLDGSREALRFQVTRLEPGRGLTYRFRGPISMLLPGGSFVVAPDNGGSSFTATLWYRFGPLTRLVFHRRVAVLRQHVREEALNLKRNIEAGHGVPDPRPCADPSIGRWRRR